ncbi:GyrI-like domain-containing protein [Cutibacterium equinum]|uniref:GyrI-like domain-containing protein n=1 Tax=Cutibacterium equinum TaxID=3016342 RepID=A0ABY7QXW9_9ACTN|nr:GyrI-like domain-containing protein [Cutibacterium equinum]WCC79898.1 GyrI-like domain-containing protein [Cutibacterium equinum]
MDRPVKIRQVDACHVISMTRVVSIDELDPFMDEAFKALERFAPGDPALGKDSPFVFYHDGLTADHDGTVEVCQPIQGSIDDSVLPEDVTVRTVEAHREAWVTVTKAELEYPDIDEIYDDFEAWLEEAGMVRNGAPREVYWANWDTTGMEEPVCDVCFPIA